MKELLLLIRERLFNNEKLVLATLIKSSGSAPRESGARMLVGVGASPNARLWGSVGGGYCEHLAIEEAASLLRLGQKVQGFVPRVSVKSYLLHPNDAADIGARCGGEITVFFRVLDPAEPGLLTVIEQGISSFGEKKPSWFIMGISDGSSYNQTEDGVGDDFFLAIAGEEALLASTVKRHSNLDALLKNRPVCVEQDGKFVFSEPLVSGGIVYIFGGGHIAQELLPLLSHLDFRCVIFDDREEFSKPDLFPGADKVILGSFENIGEHIKLTRKDFAVIVTRGHLYDFETWAFALSSPAYYIGVIGSKTKHGFVKGRLRALGYTNDEINAPRVRAPIGMEIKSETPAEIAVSIAGELVLYRARFREQDPVEKD